MQRQLSALASQPFDVLIVGGGMYGAAMAREAATRGLKTALIEQADFCSGTSANSLKIIHGGLRYLQQADLPRVFESIRERSILLRTAPHLVAPMPCLMPTRGWLMKSRLVMFAGMLANDILSCWRNGHLQPLRHLPNGGTLSRRAILDIVPQLGGTSITGAARWFDGFAYDTERLVVGIVKAAADAGAEVANYVRLQSLRLEGNRVVGAVAQDRLTGETFDIRAAYVVNAAGPWIGQVLDQFGRALTQPAPHAALGMNLIVRNWPVQTHALALQSPRQSRLYFFVPWRGAVMAGTYYREYTGAADDLRVTEEDIRSYLDALNSCLPGAALTPDDILGIQLGIIPSRKPARPDREPALLRHYKLINHARSDGIQGLFSICGIKYTTARGVAAQVVGAIARHLNKTIGPSITPHTPLPGGDIPDLAAYQRELAAARPDIPAPQLEHLIALYGTETRGILAQAATLSGPEPLLRAQCLMVIREEMPQTLGDLLYRRLGQATGQPLPPDQLRAAAETMAAERQWSADRLEAEISSAGRVTTYWQAATRPAP